MAGRRLAVFFLLSLSPLWSHAQVALNAEEQRVVAWLRTVDPALRYLDDLRDMVEIELEMQLEIPGACGKRRFRDDSDRLANPAYAEVVRAALTRWKAQRPKADPAALDTFSFYEQAVIFSYRQADIPSRRAWLAFIGTAGARTGRDALRKIEEAVHFRGRYGYDASGANPQVEWHVTWLHWLDEYLQKAGLRDAFLAAMEERERGFRADFLEFVSTTPPDRTEEFEQLDRSLDEISGPPAKQLTERLIGLSAPAVQSSIRQWSSHPMVVRTENNLREMLEISRTNDYGKDPDLGGFMRMLRSESMAASDRTLSRVAKAVVSENCARLP